MEEIKDSGEVLVRPDHHQLENFGDLIPFRPRELSKYFEVGRGRAELRFALTELRFASAELEGSWRARCGGRGRAWGAGAPAGVGAGAQWEHRPTHDPRAAPALGARERTPSASPGVCPPSRAHLHAVFPFDPAPPGAERQPRQGRARPAHGRDGHGCARGGPRLLRVHRRHAGQSALFVQVGRGKSGE